MRSSSSIIKSSDFTGRSRSQYSKGPEGTKVFYNVTGMGVDITSRTKGRKISAPRLKRAAEKILEFLREDQSELSLVLVGNEEIRELNATYRGKNRPTDVLSFPSGENQAEGLRILGDVVISVEQAEIQARKRRKTLEEEVRSLLIHGILHLLGYDHERSQKEARIMKGMEKKIEQALCERRDLRV